MLHSPPTGSNLLVQTTHLELQELADIVEYRAAPKHRLDDGGEVVVQDDDAVIQDGGSQGAEGL